MLKRFPPVRILSAGNDPLRDEQYKFTLRLINNNIDVKIKEYICFPHGFLNYELPIGGIDECFECNKQAVAYIKEFLKDEKEEPFEFDPVVKDKSNTVLEQRDEKYKLDMDVNMKSEDPLMNEREENKRKF